MISFLFLVLAMASVAADKSPQPQSIVTANNLDPQRLPTLGVWEDGKNGGSSKLLMHPLLSDGGGDFYHSGGKHWNSILDPEWQTLANWVCGRKTTEKIAELTGSCTAE